MNTPAQQRPSARVRWLSRLGLLLVRALGATWRVHRVNPDGWTHLRREKKGFIMATWHGVLLPSIFAHRGEGIVALVSEHSDGEIIARIIAGLGYDTSRGSSTRGGARGLLGIIRALESGLQVAFTPDGPRGPRHVMQPGMVAAAKRADAPVLVLGVAVSRAWRFKSWDQFVVPQPFARIVIAYGGPAAVSSDDTDVEVARFTTLMQDATRTAENALSRG